MDNASAFSWGWAPTVLRPPSMPVLFVLDMASLWSGLDMANTIFFHMKRCGLPIQPGKRWGEGEEMGRGTVKTMQHPKKSMVPRRHAQQMAYLHHCHRVVIARQCHLANFVPAKVHHFENKVLWQRPNVPLVMLSRSVSSEPTYWHRTVCGPGPTRYPAFLGTCHRRFLNHICLLLSLVSMILNA